MSPENPSNAPDSREISVAARFAALPGLLAWIERETRAGGLAAATTKRMQLAVEELFANAIHHGYGEECDARVTLALHIDGNLARVTFSDSARPFDPLSALPLPADPERLGGVGLNLVRALAGSIKYRRDAGRNIMTLAFPDAETLQ